MRKTLLLVLALICGHDALAATRVDLVLNEVQERSLPWPVNTGVPFPRDKLTSPAQCRLIDDQGKEHPLQAKVAATWDGPKGSVRWLTIDFIAAPGHKFALEFGADVTPAKFESPLVVEEKDLVRVKTGTMSMEFPKKGFSTGNVLIGDVPVKFAAVSSSVDHEGLQSHTVGEDRQVVVEAKGPIRPCVRVDEAFVRTDGKRQLESRVRYHFFAGLGLVKVVHETRFVSSTKGTGIRSLDFALALELNREKWQVDVDQSGEPGNQVLTVRPDANTLYVSSYQSIYRHYGNPECRGGVVGGGLANEIELHKTERVGEWMQVGDDKIAVTGSMRWFSQQFPVEWKSERDSLRLRLWSPRGGDLDFGVEGIKRFMGEAGEKYLLDWKGTRKPQTPIENFFYFAGRDALKRGDADGKGINKHHEFYLHFARADQAKVGQEYGRLVADPPIALASGAWNASTDVMGPIAARPNDSPYEAIVDRIFDMSRKAQDDFGDYGWWLFGAGPHYSYQWDAKTGKHYADPRRFEYHTYQRETQQWWNYLRSGERKFLDWCLPAENHWVDIAVSHQPTTYFTEYQGGEIKPATLPWARGDWAIDSTVHYLRHHDTGEAWLRGQSQFWATYHRTLETTTLAYFLTGDERFNDVVEYWRAYYGDLAGKTSDSKDFQPWHKAQAWYQPTPVGKKAKTWAEMIRDYAPFNSGSRHQLTLFFNLATLYEHTWDPKIGQALKEYADAFLDPNHHLGVWRSQDNGEPIRAAAPIMAHYWTPALWRYHRATNDPRMPGILNSYFDACLGADPYLENVGVYSNVHIGYAYAFSKDPRHLRAALAELEALKPNALPLAKPEDLGERLYNPYAPIRALTAVPRLIWALEEAKRTGVKIPPPPLMHPQRAPIAWKTNANAETRLTFWGYEKTLDMDDPDVKIVTTQHASVLQPFDRTLPGFAVYEHRVTFPKSAAKWHVFQPKLDLALIEGSDALWCQASRPVAIHPGDCWYWPVPANPPGSQFIQTGSVDKLDFAVASGGLVDGRGGPGLEGKGGPSGWHLSLGKQHVGATICLENKGKTVLWFRLADLPDEQAWVATSDKQARIVPVVMLPKTPKLEAPKDDYIEGQFGKAIVVRPGKSLTLPDHQKLGGAVKKFFDAEQGTLEFWAKPLWDPRLIPASKLSLVGNGVIETPANLKLAQGEWTHIALVWRPLPKDPKQVVMHAYVNGHDQANYRNVYWEGYGDRPPSVSKNAKWLETLLSKAPPGTAFALDELRLSSVPRYIDAEAVFGRDQTVNLHRFTPANKAFVPDAQTLLLFHFDGDLQNHPGDGQPRLVGTR